MTQLPAYQELARRHLRMHRLGHLQSIAHWDRSANMPAKGNEARAAALAEMGGLLHELATAADLPQLLGSAEGEALGDFERASLREMQRAWRASNAPAGLPRGAGTLATMASRISSMPMPVLAEQGMASVASMPITSSISDLALSGSACGRSILLSTGTTSTPSSSAV